MRPEEQGAGDGGGRRVKNITYKKLLAINFDIING
jgi:hypothetical protein